MCHYWIMLWWRSDSGDHSPLRDLRRKRLGSEPGQAWSMDHNTINGEDIMQPRASHRSSGSHQLPESDIFHKTDLDKDQWQQSFWPQRLRHGEGGRNGVNCDLDPSWI